MVLLINWVINALIIISLAYILPAVTVENFFVALVVAIVVGLLNAILRPILLLLTLPINILTLGLFTLVINAGIILLAEYLIPGFSVGGFWWALLFGLILSLANFLFANQKARM